jgi:Mlc titration factor MtfA (ptsG expression regulator)
MIFTWLRRRRRKKLLARPFPPEWEPYLRSISLYRALDPEERKRLRDDLRVLVHEKNWEGCGGLTITDEMKVTIAAQAALLALNLEHDYFRHVDSILVYPSTFLVPGEYETGGGIVVVGREPVLGLAHYEGPVVLAWDSVQQGSENAEDGVNVVLHEFAHKLDMLDDFADGTPPLPRREQYEAWRRIMTEEYETLVEKAGKRRKTLLDKYGATNPAEFFAVATECFFEKSRAMKRRHPELYGLLSTYYRQDPARRGRGEAAS